MTPDRPPPSTRSATTDPGDQRPNPDTSPPADQIIPEVLRALDESDPRLHLVRHRWNKRTERKVFSFDQRAIVKTFVFHPGRNDRRKSWNREWRALARLDGGCAPRPIGIHRTRIANRPAVVLVREFIEGTTPDLAASKNLAQFAALLVDVHHRGVLTGDPNPGNWMRDPLGKPYFLDFGRARTFPRHTPAYWFYLGKELTRVQHSACQRDPLRFQAFMRAYRNEAPLPTGWRLTLVQAGYRYWCRRRDMIPEPLAE